MSESIRQLAAIMFTDIAGYTSLMGEDSQKALEQVRINMDIQAPLVEKHNGKWVKEMGDGSLSYFNSALDAVNCSIEIQESARTNLDVKLRIGIHLGDITIQNDDVYGDGVNVASRLESKADPGGIYISDATQKAIRGQSDFQAKYLGEIKLKNVDYPVKTFAIQGTGLPVAIKKSIWNKLHGSKNYRIIIILLTLFLGLIFREILNYVLINLNITPIWSEIFLYTILLLLPTLATILFIPRDKSRFLRVSRRLIPPINVLISVMTLVFLFWGRELGAMTTIVSYEDEQGNTRETTALKYEFVKIVGTYPFELKKDGSKNSLRDEDSWLGMGIAYAINHNIQQYLSIETWVGVDNVSLKEKLDNLGYFADYLVLGNYEWLGDSLVVNIQIYNKQAKLFHKQTLTSRTLFEMSDAIKLVLLDQLELHSSVKDQTDLPFTAFITDNERAFRHCISGNNLAAIREDSAYAYAYLGELYDSFHFGLRDSYKKQLVEDGLDKMSKLPEKDQLKFRAFYFLTKGEKEKALRAYERYVSLNPGDPKVFRSYVYFLATNGYYEKALEVSREQFSKKFDEGYGLIMLQLASLIADPGQLDQLKQDIQRVKMLIPDDSYNIVMAQLDLVCGDLANARRNYQEAQLENPLFYTLDSLIKVTNFLEDVDNTKLKKFMASITGTYLNERSDQTYTIKYDNERLGIFWEGQIPDRAYPIDQNSIYYCNPYYSDQEQYTESFIKGAHGQILKAKSIQQDITDTSEIYFYKATPELLEAMGAFRLKDYTKADSLFQCTLDYDSGYYFVRNFIDAINYSKKEGALKLQNLLNGKRFTREDDNKLFLKFSFIDNVFLLESGGVPQEVYPIDDHWIMSAFNKLHKYQVSGTENNLSIDVYHYENNRYEKESTYHQ